MGQIILPRPPQDDDELWWVIKTMFGVELPRVSVCEEHVSPFHAVAHAFFGRAPNYAVWYASRGSGKSLALAVLGLVKSFVMDVDVTILGGSMTQSKNVAEHMAKLMAYENAPMFAMEKRTATELRLHSQKTIRPLPASQTTVRGPHPPLQLLDEVDEMEMDIYDASMGQAMEQDNHWGLTVPEYIVASSTWQNPEGCGDASSPTVTRRGVVRLDKVVVGDEVPTRSGWRRVTASLDMGMQECVTVELASGRVLRCTPWHPVWVEGSGFTRADALPEGALVAAYDVGVRLTPPSSLGVSTDAASTLALADAGADLHQSVRSSEVVAGRAHGQLVDAVLGASSVVLGNGDRFEVPGVDAVPALAPVVQVGTLGDRPDDLHVDPAVGRHDSLRQAAVALDPVAVLHDAEGPQNAVVGVEVDGYVFAQDEVRCIHSSMVLPTWDLTVEDCHEYVLSGVLVHNTFTEVIDRARRNNMPVFTWCWRELLKTEANPTGWMTKRFIDNKRKTVSEQMWKTEYELNEPSGASRAFDLDALEAAFVPYPLAIRHVDKGDEEQSWVWEEPKHSSMYVVGADWGKEQDYTVISVMKVDQKPYRMVKQTVIKRRPYPVMIGMFNRDKEHYHALGAVHDKTGLGNVVNDYVEYSDTVEGFNMVGRPRTQMLLDYVAAVEHGDYQLPSGEIAAEDGTPLLTEEGKPRVDDQLAFLRRSHRGTTVADVYAPGKWDSHIPDRVVGMALAHRAVSRLALPTTESSGVPRSKDGRKADDGFNQSVNENEVRSEGGVVIVDDDGDPYGTKTEDLFDMMVSGRSDYGE